MAEPALLGRSRGVRTTKIHALTDALGLPILLKLIGGRSMTGGRSADNVADISGEGCIVLANRSERFSSKPKHVRAVATGYDQRRDQVVAFAKFASIRIWLRHTKPVN